MQQGLPQNFPAEKKRELEQVVTAIRENAEVEMIILYGSYAKGDFVIEDKSEERGTIFRSDFDLLIITKNQKTEEKFEAWELTEKEIMQNENILTKPQFVVTNIEHVNRKLKQGRYFLKDIYEEGILLYDSGKHRLSIPAELKDLGKQERYEQAKEYFKIWNQKAVAHLENYEFNLKKARQLGSEDEQNSFFGLAALHLHQTAEKLLNCLELVFTAYRPPSHNLFELKERVQRLIPELKNFFFDEDKRCSCGQNKTPSIFKSQKGLEHICINCNPDAGIFVKLSRAYVEAQYGKHYQITSEELEAMKTKVLALKSLIGGRCGEEVERLRGKA